MIGTLISALWIGWLIYWLAAARNTKTTEWRDSALSQFLYRAPNFVLIVLLLGPRWLPRALWRRFVPAGPAVDVAALIGVCLGLGLSVWARVHLGRNWSAIVTVKRDHGLVRTGPYAVVRHPIYSGILLALVGTALSIGQWRAVAGVAVALLGFLVKLRVEERRMREMFPHEYDGYARSTAALIPFVW